MMHSEQKIVNEIFVLIPSKHDGLSAIDYTYSRYLQFLGHPAKEMMPILASENRRYLDPEA